MKIKNNAPKPKNPKKAKESKDPTFKELMFSCGISQLLAVGDVDKFSRELEKVSADFNRQVVDLGKRYGIGLVEQVCFSIQRPN